MRYILTILMCLICSRVEGGASRSFDGISDSVDFTKPSGLTVGTDSFTAMVWIYWTQGPDTASEIVISQQDGTGTGRNWIDIDDGNGDGLGGDRLISFLGAVAIDLGATAVVNIWMHVAVVSDEAAGTIQGFINGVAGTAGASVIEAATGILRLGVNKTGTVTDFEGQMRDFILCEKALSAQEITTCMRNPKAIVGIAGSNAYIYAPLFGEGGSEINLLNSALNGTLTGTASSTNGAPSFFPKGAN